MNRSGKAKQSALCAMFAALSVAILAVGSLVDVLDISLALIAGCVVMVTELEFSRGAAWSVFAVTAVLSFLLPVKTPSLLYTFFFGWYPLVRKRLAPLKRWLRVVVKVLLFNGLLALFLFISVSFFGVEREPVWMILLTFALSNLMFLLYDPALDRLTRFYLLHLRDRFHFHR